MTGAEVALREAFYTHLARPWRIVVGVALVGSLLAGPAILEMLAADTLAQVIRDETERGMNVLIVESESDQLDGVDCAAAGAIGGVLHAGGVSLPEVVSVGEMHLVSARRVFASPGYLAILGYSATSPLPFAVFGPMLSAEVSVQQQAEILFSDGSMLRTSVAPETPRSEARSRWITVPVAPNGPVQQCWIETTASALSPVRSAVPALFPGARGLSVHTLRDGNVAELAARTWKERPSMWLGLLGGVAAALAAGILLWPRRIEYALYRLIGFRRVRVALLANAEAQIVLALASVFALMMACAAGALLDSGLALLPAAAPPLLVGYGAAAFLGGVIVQGVASGDTAQILRHRT